MTNSNYAYLTNSHFTFKFLGYGISNEKKSRLEAFSQNLLYARQTITEEICDQDDPDHILLKFVYLMSKDEFCKFCRETYNKQFGLTSSCDTELYSQIYDALSMKFSHIRKCTQMKLRDYTKDCSFSTYMTKLLSFIMNRLVDFNYSKDAIIKKIEAETASEPNVEGMNEDEKKAALDKYNMFCNFERIMKGRLSDRVFNLAVSRFNRVLDRESKPVEFVSDTFKMRVRSQVLISKNTNRNSKLKFFMDLGNFDGQGKMVVPIKYSENYFGSVSRFKKNLSCSPSYMVTVTHVEDDFYFLTTVEGPRTVPVLASFRPEEDETGEKKEKKNRRQGTRHESKSETKVTDHYENISEKDARFFDSQGNEIIADDYVCLHTAAHDVNLKHNALSAMITDEGGEMFFKTFDWNRKNIDSFAYLKEIEKNKKSEFEKNKSNQIRNIEKRIVRETDQVLRDELLSQLETVKKTRYKRAKWLDDAFKKLDRKMNASTGRMIHEYGNWLEENGIIHVICEDLSSSSFGKQDATYDTTDRKGNPLSLNYNNLMKFCKMQTLNERIKMSLAKRLICVSFAPAAYTSQRCPVCGHIERGNRVTQEKYKCRKCEFEYPADSVSP